MPTRIAGPCPTPGCPNRAGSCPTHQPQSRQRRGYDAAHGALRADYQRRMNSGQTYTCWRCGKPVDPTAWDLGHQDGDKTQHRGPEHVKCNRGTSSRR